MSVLWLIPVAVGFFAVGFLWGVRWERPNTQAMREFAAKVCADRNELAAQVSSDTLRRLRFPDESPNQCITRDGRVWTIIPTR